MNVYTESFRMYDVLDCTIYVMLVVPTSKSNMDEKVRLVDNDVPDECVLCTEKTIPICGVHVKRWCLLLVLLSAALTSATVIAVIYALRLQTLTACRLTYSNNATVQESEMQKWAAKDDWPLSVPRYDPWRRTCVCEGYETRDPTELQPTDEVLVWIAPGDLITLADSGKIGHFNAEFESTYKGDFAEDNHVKVCMQQQFLLDLWAYSNTTGQTSCHSSSGPSGSIIERFYLGWDGALFCASTFDNTGSCKSTTDCASDQYCDTDYKCKSSPVGEICTGSITLGIDKINYDCCCSNSNDTCAYSTDTQECGCCPNGVGGETLIDGYSQYTCHVTTVHAVYQKTCDNNVACSIDFTSQRNTCGSPSYTYS
jgi:hypothetical protein